MKSNKAEYEKYVRLCKQIGFTPVSEHEIVVIKNSMHQLTYHRFTDEFYLLQELVVRYFLPTNPYFQIQIIN